MRSDALKALLMRQDDVVRREQLRAVGLTWAELDAQLTATRWRAVGPVVVVAHNGPLTAQQEHWVATLHCGRRAALAARTAAAVGGLIGWESPRIEVVVPRGTSVDQLAELPLIVHESRRLRDVDIHPSRLPRRTRMERSLVDAAAWSRDDRSACGILCAGVQQRLTTAQRLRRELLSAGRVRRRALLLATVDDVEGGAQALSEIDFVKICRRWDLQVSARQEVRRDAKGRRRYLDVTLNGPDGRLVRVEIDGALHLLVRNYWDDMMRQNEYTIAGEPVLRFASVAVRIDEWRVVDQLARALSLGLVRSRPGSDLLSA